jgi:hypothetical protein
MQLLIPKKASMKSIKTKLEKLLGFDMDINGGGFDIVEEKGSRGNVFAEASLHNASPDDDWAILTTKPGDVRVQREVNNVSEFLADAQDNQYKSKSPKCDCCDKCSK